MQALYLGSWAPPVPPPSCPILSSCPSHHTSSSSSPHFPLCPEGILPASLMFPFTSPLPSGLGNCRMAEHQCRTGTSTAPAVTDTSLVLNQHWKLQWSFMALLWHSAPLVCQRQDLSIILYPPFLQSSYFASNIISVILIKSDITGLANTVIYE